MRKFRILLLVSILLGGAYFLGSRTKGDLRRVTEPIQAVSRIWQGPDSVRGAGLSPDEVNNIEIYRMANQATVNITSTVYQRGWFLEYYPAKEAGSGFIIDGEGKILTNNHVISGSSKIEVVLADHSTYTATVLDRDPSNDLALIQIKPKKKLPFLRLGDSEKLQVGQKVLAIGNPFRLEGTLTTGVVSALGREIQGENQRVLEGVIQTDAAINPGNSGGPLLDSQGNVVGINTAIYGPGGNIGIGFAMPIAKAKVMLDDFQAGRKYRKPRLGIDVVYVAGDVAEALELPGEGGLLIQRVTRGSAAEQAGLRGARQAVIIGNYEVGVGGDLIMAIDGKPVDRADSLSTALSRRRAGDTIDLTLFRGGRKVNVKVRLGEAPEERL
jgi:S1-C subfamily serine protease